MVYRACGLPNLLKPKCLSSMMSMTDLVVLDSVFVASLSVPVPLMFRRRSSGSIEGETLVSLELVDPGRQINMVQRVAGAQIQCSIVFCLALVARVIAFRLRKDGASSLPRSLDVVSSFGNDIMS
jgi:hypothetical protein